MRLIPLNDKVLIQRDGVEAVTAGGIIIPGAEKGKPERGVVIEAGPGVRSADGTRSPLGVKAGDIVYFSKYAGQEIKLGGETFLVVLESEIQVVFEP